MNTLVENLSRVCRERVLDEKWLVAPSLRVAQQWLDSATRGGQPVANVRVMTLTSLALTLGATEMGRRGLSLIPAQAGAVIIDGILRRLHTPDGYLLSLGPSPSLAEAIHSSIQALRSAGVTGLPTAGFEIELKGREIARVLEAYLAELSTRKLIDRAGLAQLALEHLRRNPQALPSGAFLLLPADIQCSAVERLMLEVIPSQHKVELTVDQGTGEVGLPADRDLTRLRWFNEPAKAPAPIGDGTVSMFRAVGAVNEVREVLRRCLADGHRLDDVELLHTDFDTYVPLIYETACRLANETKDLADGLPVTFAEGIPARYSRPGRALAAWVSWIDNDLLQATLVRMIQDGLLRFPGEEGTTLSFLGLAGLLRPIGIGFGRERYLARIDETIAGFEKRRAAETSAQEDEPSEPEDKEYVERRLAGLATLRLLVKQLLAATPLPTDTPAGILSQAIRFLEGHARAVDHMDNLAANALVERIRELAALVSDEATSINALDYLRALPGQLHVGGSSPRPGHLHVAHFSTGGHSGRGITFIMGMDDSRFPGVGLQDPVLLDEERQGISGEIRTSRQAMEDRQNQFGRLLARLRGWLTLSFPCRDLADDRELFPSPAILTIYRILSGNHGGDQCDLIRWLPPMVSFATDRPEACLDPAEWWLWRLCREGQVPGAEKAVLGAEKAVLGFYPGLVSGRKAGEERGSNRFTEFDGLVPEAGADADPTGEAGMILSASRLETLGQCPLRFFFKYVLRIEPPEELEIDPAQWLDALSTGSLLHEVFCRFMRELSDIGQLPPIAVRDRDRMERILTQEIAAWREAVPPPNELAYQRQCRTLRTSARVFLTTEAERCKEGLPTYMEASIGLDPEGDGTPLDTKDPMTVALPDGRGIRVRGRIDRVDRIGDAKSAQFAIWDYKTGSRWKYEQDPPFWQGRVVQHVLYLMMGAARLRELHPKCNIRQVGFLFPSQRGEGEAITFSAERLAPGRQIIADLCRMIADGTFPSTTDSKEDCHYCDFTAVCGDLSGSAVACGRKLANEANVTLDTFRGLRTND